MIFTVAKGEVVDVSDGVQKLTLGHWISLIKRQKGDRERIRGNESLLLSLRKGQNFARQMLKLNR